MVFVNKTHDMVIPSFTFFFLQMIVRVNYDFIKKLKNVSCEYDRLNG